MGNLATNPHFEWGPADHKLSEVLQGYFANFVKTGNTNGPGLPTWPAYAGSDGFQVMRLDVESRAEPETTRPRCLFLDLPPSMGSRWRSEGVYGFTMISGGSFAGLAGLIW